LWLLFPVVPPLGHHLKGTLVNALSAINGFEDMDADGAVSRSYEPMQRKQRRPEPRRKSQGGSNGGGIHCRRNKHSFGSGQSARLADLRAFAGAIVVALVGLMSPALAGAPRATEAAPDTFNAFTWKAIGNPGNAANSVTGLGAVADSFKMSAYETTNSQYAYFLNHSVAGRDNLYGVYNSYMFTNANGGIKQVAPVEAGGAYTYEVVSGFADKPVNYVNWFSAARFINWYANGAKVSSSTETGSYTIPSSAVSGNPVARNANATVFLPSADEWTKAAFYDANSGTYALWPTGQNSTPTGTTPTTGENVANFAQGISGEVQVTGSYTDTVSTYGLWDMLGNVGEMSDTSSINTAQIQAGNGTTWVPFGGSYATRATGLNSIDQWNSSHLITSAEMRATTIANSTLGFRVAAVPEPGNMVAAAMGVGGLIALQFVKRRKLALARVQAC